MTVPAVLSHLSLPVIASPMFIISTPKLVIEQCKAGVVGSMPALNARPASQLDEWLAEITETLGAYNRQHPDAPAAPFAINQIVHKSNDRLEHDMQMCAKYKVPLVITSLGARTDVNDAVHAWGGIVMHDIINDTFARKAIEKGADGLIAVAAGAGGHAGTTSPFALVQEIRRWFDGPLALSGSIATGGAVLAAQAMGADFAYIGSAFIATDRATAWARASGSSSERLKIALKVWRLATLKKHRAEMDMCRSIGSMWGRNTPLATPRSYTACTAFTAIHTGHDHAQRRVVPKLAISASVTAANCTQFHTALKSVTATVYAKIARLAAHVTPYHSGSLKRISPRARRASRCHRYNP